MFCLIEFFLVFVFSVIFHEKRHKFHILDEEAVTSDVGFADDEQSTVVWIASVEQDSKEVAVDVWPQLSEELFIELDLSLEWEGISFDFNDGSDLNSVRKLF